MFSKTLVRGYRRISSSFEPFSSTQQRTPTTATPVAAVWRLSNNNFFSTNNGPTTFGAYPPILPKPSVENVPQPLTPEGQQPKTFWQRFMDEYSIKGQQNRIHRAEALYQAAYRQAFNPIWYGPGRIGREFRPRHAMITLHIWLLHKRLIADKVDEDLALAVQEELFNILWDDTTCRIRQQGVNELAVNKHLLQVQQYTFLHLTHYDHAYTEFLDKPVQRLRELRKIIYQHILVRAQPEVVIANRFDHLDRIAWYIDCNYQNIMLHWPDDLYKESRVTWTTIPDFSNMKDVDGITTLENIPIHDDDVLPGPWLRNITNRGTDYYWNPITRQSVWEKPDGSSNTTNNNS